MIHLYGVNRLSGNYRVILEMNERLKLGSRKLVANVRTWVSGASAAGLSESLIYKQAGTSLGRMFDACERRRAGQVTQNTCLSHSGD